MLSNREELAVWRFTRRPTGKPWPGAAGAVVAATAGGGGGSDGSCGGDGGSAAGSTTASDGGLPGASAQRLLLLPVSHGLELKQWADCREQLWLSPAIRKVTNPTRLTISKIQCGTAAVKVMTAIRYSVTGCATDVM